MIPAEVASQLQQCVDALTAAAPDDPEVQQLVQVAQPIIDKSSGGGEEAPAEGAAPTDQVPPDEGAADAGAGYQGGDFAGAKAAVMDHVAKKGSLPTTGSFRGAKAKAQPPEDAKKKKKSQGR